MKGLDLRNFRKVSANSKHTTMEHPDGHEIKISHKGLDPATRAQLHALPFAEGGEVPRFANGGGVQRDTSMDAPPNVQMNPQAGASGSWGPDSSGPSMFGFGVGNDHTPQAGGASGNWDGGDTATTPRTPSSNIPLPTSSAGPAAPLPGANTSGLNLAMQGARAEGKASGDIATAQMGVMQNQSDLMQSIATQTQSNAAAHDQEVNSVINDMRNGHIDPSHYVNNMSTGSKISTAIGLILGGMGAGITHSENPAQQFLMKNIDNDIEAQKANLNQKSTLLGALEKQYGNKQDALKMLQSIYIAKTASDMQTEALKRGDQMSKARADQVVGPLLQQKQQLVNDVAQRQAILSHVNGGAMDPAQAVPYLVPKEQQAKVYDSLGKVNELNNLQKDMNESSQHLSGEFLHGALSPNDTASAKKSFAAIVEKASAGRYNHEAAMMQVESMLPQTMDSSATIANKDKRRAEFFDAMRSEHAPVLRGNNIPVPAPAPSTTPGAGPQRR